MNIATIDFQMTVKSNGWSSDKLKYADLAKDASMLVDMLDDLDADLEVITFIFNVSMTYDQVMRMFRLFAKGRNHMAYHFGRSLQATSAYDPDYSRDGQTLVFRDICKVENASWDGNKSAPVTITFEDILKIQNQQLRGFTIVANLIRLANLIAWSVVNDVKLSPKPVTMKTWNTITIWGESPWTKKVEGVGAVPDDDDLYAEE